MSFSIVTIISAYIHLPSMAISPVGADKNIYTFLPLYLLRHGHDITPKRGVNVDTDQEAHWSEHLLPLYRFIIKWKVSGNVQAQVPLHWGCLVKGDPDMCRYQVCFSCVLSSIFFNVCIHYMPFSPLLHFIHIDRYYMVTITTSHSTL